MRLAVSTAILVAACVAPAAGAVRPDDLSLSRAQAHPGGKVRVTASLRAAGGGGARAQAAVVLHGPGGSVATLLRRRVRLGDGGRWSVLVTVPRDTPAGRHEVEMCLASDGRSRCDVTGLRVVGAATTATEAVGGTVRSAPVVDAPVQAPTPTPPATTTPAAPAGAGGGGGGGGGDTVSSGAAAAQVTAAAVLAQAAPATDMTTETTPFIRGIWHNKAAKAATTPATWAQGVNADWEQGRRSDWFVELQASDDFVLGGILDGDPRQIDYGLHISGWAFDRQSADGSFPGQTAHSTLYFVASTARSLIQLRRSSFAGQFATELDRQTAALARAAAWLIAPSVWNDSVAKNLAMYGHRHFRDAAALGLTALATQNASLLVFARSELAAGLDSQNAAGWIPELTGYDVGYNAVAMDYAVLYDQYFPTDPLAGRLDRTIDASLSWERGWVAPDGHLETGSSTRSCVLRQGYSGELNPPGYMSVVHAMAVWSVVDGDAQLDSAARKVYAYKTSGGPQCPVT